MSAAKSWLPDLITLSGSGGAWETYLEVLYARFCKDYKYSRPTFLGQTVDAKYHPNYRGKEDGFWHLITAVEKGTLQKDRLPEMRRCETIAWPRAAIDACGTTQVVWWRNRRGRHKRVVIALPDFSWVVVLDERPSKFVLWTQYHVEYPKRRADLKAEWAAYWESQK